MFLRRILRVQKPLLIPSRVISSKVRPFKYENKLIFIGSNNKYVSTQKSSYFSDVFSKFLNSDNNSTITEICKEPNNTVETKGDVIVDAHEHEHKQTINYIIHNMKHLDSFSVEYLNIETYSFRKYMFSIKLNLKKGNMVVTEEFHSNSIDELLRKIKKFLVNEIKI